MQPKSISARLWSKAGDFNQAFSKGPKTTTWIWNLHAEAHDFHLQESFSSMKIRRKIFAANLAHLSIVFFWLAGMHFHGAYFSNYSLWLKDPKNLLPGAQLVWSLVGQDLLNSDIGGSFQAIHITSGLFPLWRSEGIITAVELKDASAAAGLATLLSLAGAFFHMHLSSPSLSFFQKFKSLGLHHLSLFLALASLSWSAHLLHISLPAKAFLDSAIDPMLIPCAEDFIFQYPIDYISEILPGFGLAPFSSLAKGVSILGSSGKFFNSSTRSLFLTQVAAHHFYLALVLLLSSLLALALPVKSFRSFRISQVSDSWHAQLSVNLAVTASLSLTFAHHISSIPVYAFAASDYPRVLSLFTHHMWIGAFILVGAAAHASLFLVSEKLEKNSLDAFFQEVFNQRDVILGHLLWVTIALGSLDLRGFRTCRR